MRALNETKPMPIAAPSKKDQTTEISDFGLVPSTINKVYTMALKCLLKSAKRVPFFWLPKKTHKSKFGWEFATKKSKNGTQMPRQKCQRVPFFWRSKKP